VREITWPNKAVKEGAISPVLIGVKKTPKEGSLTFLAHLYYKMKETKTKETNQWLETILGDHQRYILPKTKNPDPAAIKAPKHLATRYYQLKQAM
jgi:hypothetical protein